LTPFTLLASRWAKAVRLFLGEGLIPAPELLHQRERASCRLAEELKRIRGPMTG
jgi:hypothetical protein